MDKDDKPKSLPQATLSARGLRGVFGDKRPGDPSNDQTQEQIAEYYRNAAEGAPAVIRETYGSSLTFKVTKVTGSNPRLGRVYVDEHTAYGGLAYYIKTGKNCRAPKGQTSLVVPTEPVLQHAQKHPRGEIIMVDYGSLKRV
jgi:hypothetical protein